MKLRPILFVTLSIVIIAGCKKDAPPQPESQQPSTQQVTPLEWLGRQFIVGASNEDSEAIKKLFITLNELKATVTGESIDTTYSSIQKAFDASLQEALPSLKGAEYVRMNMEFCPEPVPVKAGMAFGSGTKFRVDTLAADNIRVIANIAGVEREIKLDALVKVDNNWRLFSPIEILP